MSSAGSPRHDAQAYSFMKTINVEQVYLAGYETFADVAAQRPSFIADVDNAKCLHFARGCLPLNDFESQLVGQAA